MSEQDRATPAKPPSDEERAQEWLDSNIGGYWRRSAATRESLTAQFAQVRAEASQEKDAEIERLKAESEGRRKVLVEKADEVAVEWRRAEAAEAERDALKARLSDVEGERDDAFLEDATFNAMREERDALREENARLREESKTERGFTDKYIKRLHAAEQANARIIQAARDHGPLYLHEIEALLAPTSARCGRKFQDKHGRQVICVKGNGHAADCVGSLPPASEPAPEKAPAPDLAEQERLRTCGQHPTLGDVTRHGSRACGRVLSVVDLYRCANCQTAFCRDCIKRHFADETPEAQEARWKAELAADADGDENCLEEAPDGEGE